MARLKYVPSLTRTPSKPRGPRRSGRIRRETEFYDEPPVPVKHRKRKTKKEKTPPLKKVKSGRVEKTQGDTPAKLTKSGSGSKKKGKKVKEPKEKKPKHKRHANDKLKPRTGIKSYTKDPTFETKEEIPFISVKAYQKLAIRAVLLNSPELLKRLINDTKHVSSIFSSRAPDILRSALGYAILNENSKLVGIMLGDEAKPKAARVTEMPSLLQKSGTGTYNYHMLGHAVRNIQMGRGGREGNNAFLKNEYASGDDLNEAIRKNVSFAFMQEMVLKKKWNTMQLANNIYQAVRWGHRKLAGKMIETYNTYSFNELHKQVLLFDKQKLKEFRAVSVKKKGGKENKDIFPLHCACINPNHTYLEALIAIEPDFNAPDDNGRRSMHYAAACEGNEPLTLLIKKGASLYDVDKQGHTPFYIAAETGRLHNLELLAKELEKADNTGMKAFLNQKTRYGMAPIHVAAQHGDIDTVKKLAELGADLELQTGAGKGKVNAFMLAAQQGHLELVKYLYEKHNVVVEKKDKLKRTALIHATLNGAAHVVSYLLTIGSDADHPDSSGNTPTHYAAAYGWYFCLKLLLDAGADANKPNDWQLTPLAVAYLKGHMGLVDIFMNQPGIDIDCKDDKGMTLVDVTLTGGVDEDTYDQLKYLIVDKKARCDIRDTMGNTALHYLAAANTNIHNQTSADGKRKTPEEIETEKAEIDTKLAKLMIDHGYADPAQENDEKKTPFMIALSGGKLKLAEVLVQNGSRLPEDELPMEKTENVLHTLAKNAARADAAVLLKELSSNQKKHVQTLLKLVDGSGFNPFLRAIKDVAPGNKEQQRNLIKYLQTMKDILPQVLETRVGFPGEKAEKLVDEGDNSDSESDSDSNESMEQEESSEPKKRKRVIYSDEDEEEDEEEEESEEEYDSEDDFEDNVPSRERGNEHNTVLQDQGSTVLHLAVNKSSLDFEDSNIPKPLLQFLLDECKKYFQQTRKIGDFLELRDRSTGCTPLLMALNKRDEESAILLIKAGANVNAVTRRQVATKPAEPEPEPNRARLRPWRNPFGSAPVQKKEESKKTPKGPNRVSSVMIAIKHALPNVLDQMIQKKANLTLGDSNQDTALHYACALLTSQFADFVRKLLKAGAPVDQTNKKGRTPLHIACNADTGSADVCTESVDLLLDAGADQLRCDVRGRVPLHYAFVKIGKAEEKSVIDPIALVSVLLRNLDGKASPWNISDEFGQTPLHRAAFRGSNICCLRFLRNQGVKINQKDKQGNTPLGIAVNCGHKAFALTLLQANSDINIPFDSYHQQTDEQYEKQNRWIWAPVKSKRQQSEPEPIPNGVIRHEWQGVIYVIMDLMGTDKDALFWLLKAAIEHKKHNLALTLLRMGQSSIAESYRKCSEDDDLVYVLAKHASSKDELQTKVFDEILTVRPATARNDFATAAVAAAENGNLPLLKHMGSVHPQGNKYMASIKAGEDGHSVGTALINNIAISKEVGEYLETLHKNGATFNFLSQYRSVADITDPKGRFDRSKIKDVKTTILIRAIMSQSFKVCQFLIRNLGAKVDVTDSNGSPIIHAIRANNIELVMLLLNKDYKLDPQDETLNSPVSSPFSSSKRMFGAKAARKRQLPPDDESENGGSDGEGEEMDDEEENEDSGVEDEPEEMEDEENEEEEEEEQEEEEQEEEMENEESNESDASESPPPRGGSGRKRKAASIRSQIAKKLKKPDKTNKPDLTKNFTPTSGIDLNARSGNDGWTPMKACVSSKLLFGNWENLDMLKLLLKCGANPRHQELQDLLKEAASTGQKKMLEALRKLQPPAPTALNVQFEEHKLERVGSTTSASTPKPPLRDTKIDEDAAAFLKEDAEKRKKEAEKIPKEERERRKLKPHKNSGYDSTGDILVCQETNHLYAVLLNKVDISYGMFGFYNFYRLQLIKRRRADLFIVFTNWGRIGDEGQYQRTPFGKLEDAIKEFKSIFRAKTGNDWTSIENFQEKEKKYHLIEQPADEDLEAANVAQLDIDLKMSPPQKPKIPKPHAEFIQSIADIRSLQRNTRDVLRTKDVRQPFGRLSRERILKGMDVLQQIGQEIRAMTKAQRDHKALPADRNHRMLKIRERMCDLSNQFYRILPFGGMEHQQLQVIDSEHDWRNKYDIVESLLEFEIAGKILAAAAYRKKEIHPLDYIYSSLNTLIQTLDPSSGETQTILHYIHNTAENTKVQQIFKILNDKENVTFLQTAGKLGNRKMLWHGTRSVNMLSIMKTGLQAAPPHANHTGHLFGKGIYTADTFEKSSGYAESMGSDGNRFVLLCEVALGKTSDVTHLNIDFDRPVPKGFDSIKGMGRQAPDPAKDITMPTGAKLPLGNLVTQEAPKNSYLYLNYNEFIVFDPSQVIVRYVVVFK